MGTARRCPKCSGKISAYTEVWSSSIEFCVDNMGLPEIDGTLLPGSPEYVIATCGICGHKWRLKRVSQITDL